MSFFCCCFVAGNDKATKEQQKKYGKVKRAYTVTAKEDIIRANKPVPRHLSEWAAVV